MIVAGKFSLNGGDATIQAKYPHLLPEIEKVIAAVKAEEHQTKESIEKTMLGRMLYSPASLNFEQIVWDLLARGTADIDIPVLILGIDV